jgi:CubicO group peptidase (beta-lactamase class C family)
MVSPKFSRNFRRFSGLILLSLFLLGSGIFLANGCDPRKNYSPERLLESYENAGQNSLNIGEFTPQSALDTPSKADLADIFYNFMPQYMLDQQILGASIIVVNSSDILVASGWGNTDAEQIYPIYTDETLFRVGELTALFTWTAVMQLVETGELDLTVDINTYLENTTLEISSPFDDTITLHHLLTHSVGFEEALIGDQAKDASSILNLEEYLTLYKPAQIRPAGDVSSYSNYGVSLAGFIIEQVTDQTFRSYVQEHLINSLNMTTATCNQPQDPDALTALSPSYIIERNGYRQEEFEYTNLIPAESLMISSTDIAKFMMAHLNNGTYNGTSIFSPDTGELMHTGQFSMDPRLPGWTYGFMEGNSHSQRFLWQNFEFSGYAGELILLPDQDLGYFIVLNSIHPEEFLERGLTGKSNTFTVYREIFMEFLTELYGAPDLPDLTPVEFFAARSQVFTGEYRITQTVSSNFLKFFNLFQSDIIITATSAGTILINNQIEFIEVEPYLFQAVAVDDPQYRDLILVFLTDDQGFITYFCVANHPDIAFETIHGIDSQIFQGIVGIVCILTFAVGALASTTQFMKKIFLKRKKRTRPPEASNSPQKASINSLQTAGGWLLGIMSILNMLFIFSLFPVFSTLSWMQSGQAIYLLRVVFTIPLISRLITFLSLIVIFNAWIEQFWSVKKRVFYSVRVFWGLVWIWFLYYWNLLGYNF